jgi:hypothetical protein
VQLVGERAGAGADKRVAGPRPALALHDHVAEAHARIQVRFAVPIDAIAVVDAAVPALHHGRIEVVAVARRAATALQLGRGRVADALRRLVRAKGQDLNVPLEDPCRGVDGACGSAHPTQSRGDDETENTEAPHRRNNEMIVLQHRQT